MSAAMGTPAQALRDRHGAGGAGCSRNQDRAAPQSSRVPLAQLADIKVVRGPTNIKSEEGLLAAYVYVDFSGRDVGGYVNEAKKSVASLKIPEGYRLEWSGEYEYLVKTHERLKLVIPLTLLVIFVLIYLQYEVGDKDDNSPPRRALLPGRFILVPLPPRLQHEHRRLGGDHRPCRARRGDGRDHAPLSGTCPCGMGTERQTEITCRPEGRGHARRGRKGSGPRS